MAHLDTFVHENLLGGSNVLPVTEPVVVSSGRNLKRGTVLGRITAGAVPTTGTAGANTGNGTLTGVAGKRKIKVGAYTVTCVVVVTNGGLFHVTNPEGKIVGVAEVGTPFVSDEINLLVNDGATDYVIGDTFTITVPAGNNEVVGFDSRNVDGSGNIIGVLAEDADATSADKTSVMYVTGQFTVEGLIFVYGSDTAALFKEEFRARNIHVRNSTPA